MSVSNSAFENLSNISYNIKSKIYLTSTDIFKLYEALVYYNNKEVPVYLLQIKFFEPSEENINKLKSKIINFYNKLEEQSLLNNYFYSSFFLNRKGYYIDHEENCILVVYDKATFCTIKEIQIDNELYVLQDMCSENKLKLIYDISFMTMHLHSINTRLGLFDPELLFYNKINNSFYYVDCILCFFYDEVDITEMFYSANNLGIFELENVEELFDNSAYKVIVNNSNNNNSSSTQNYLFLQLNENLFNNIYFKPDIFLLSCFCIWLFSKPYTIDNYNIKEDNNNVQNLNNYKKETYNYPMFQDILNSLQKDFMLKDSSFNNLTYHIDNQYITNDYNIDIKAFVVNILNLEYKLVKDINIYLSNIIIFLNNIYQKKKCKSCKDKYELNTSEKRFNIISLLDDNQKYLSYISNIYEIDSNFKASKEKSTTLITPAISFNKLFKYYNYTEDLLNLLNNNFNLELKFNKINSIKNNTLDKFNKDDINISNNNNIASNENKENKDLLVLNNNINSERQSGINNLKLKFIKQDEKESNRTMENNNLLLSKINATSPKKLTSPNKLRKNTIKSYNKNSKNSKEVTRSSIKKERNYIELNKSILVEEDDNYEIRKNQRDILKDIKFNRKSGIIIEDYCDISSSESSNNNNNNSDINNASQNYNKNNLNILNTQNNLTSRDFSLNVNNFSNYININTLSSYRDQENYGSRIKNNSTEKSQDINIKYTNENNIDNNEKNYVNSNSLINKSLCLFMHSSLDNINCCFYYFDFFSLKLQYFDKISFYFTNNTYCKKCYIEAYKSNNSSIIRFKSNNKASLIENYNKYKIVYSKIKAMYDSIQTLKYKNIIKPYNSYIDPLLNNINNIISEIIGIISKKNSKLNSTIEYHENLLLRSIKAKKLKLITSINNYESELKKLENMILSNNMCVKNESLKFYNKEIKNDNNIFNVANSFERIYNILENQINTEFDKNKSNLEFNEKLHKLMINNKNYLKYENEVKNIFNEYYKFLKQYNNLKAELNFDDELRINLEKFKQYCELFHLDLDISNNNFKDILNNFRVENAYITDSPKDSSYIIENISINNIYSSFIASFNSLKNEVLLFNVLESKDNHKVSIIKSNFPLNNLKGFKSLNLDNKLIITGGLLLYNIDIIKFKREFNISSSYLSINQSSKNKLDKLNGSSVSVYNSNAVMINSNNDYVEESNFHKIQTLDLCFYFDIVSFKEGQKLNTDYHFLQCMHYKRFHHSICKINKYSFIVVGGEDNVTCEEYSLLLKKWIIKPNLPYSKYHSSLILINNKDIYLFFGLIGSGENKGKPCYSIEKLALYESNITIKNNWEIINLENNKENNIEELNICLSGLHQISNNIILIFGGKCHLNSNTKENNIPTNLTTNNKNTLTDVNAFEQEITTNNNNNNNNDKYKFKEFVYKFDINKNYIFKCLNYNFKPNLCDSYFEESEILKFNSKKCFSFSKNFELIVIDLDDFMC